MWRKAARRNFLRVETGRTRGCGNSIRHSKTIYLLETLHQKHSKGYWTFYVNFKPILYMTAPITNYKLKVNVLTILWLKYAKTWQH